MKMTYSGRFTIKFDIKSFASSDIFSNASSSKSNSALVMLLKVSLSLSPINGLKPERSIYVMTPTLQLSVDNAIGS